MPVYEPYPQPYPYPYNHLVKTILLLGGRSRRFWPLREKYLFPLLGKTVLEHQINHLREEGCDDLLLVVGPHNRKEIKKIFPKISVVEQKDLHAGMQGALLDALPRCKKEPVLIVGSDLLETDVFRTMIARFKNTKADGLILARTVKRYFPGGYLTLKGKRITGIVEKPGEGKEPSKLMNIVVHAHRDASVLLAALKKTSAKNDDGYERALAGLFKDHVYEAVRYENAWCPVKYPWHLLELLPFLLNRITKQSVHRTAKIHPSAVIEGSAVIEEGVRVLPLATIVGPCYIGKNTIIGNNALVRQASIGDHCVVGYNTEVKGSALSHHVWTHSTYIGDSIIGENVSFGAGSVTGNLRLDEEEILTRSGDLHILSGLTKFGTVIGENCRVGIHTSINPGVKIGSGSFISSASLVSEDVPDESFVKMSGGEMQVRKNKTRAPHPDARKEFRKKL